MKYAVRKRNDNNTIYNNSKGSVNFLYKNFFGRLLLKIATLKFVTNVIGKYYNSKVSVKKIDSFIKNNNINMSEYEESEYRNFNEFFTRKIKDEKRVLEKEKDVFISPCDSKLTIYDITEDLCMKIKDSYYSIDTLVEKDIVSEYIGGKALVFRLDVTDYHRYCYIDDGYHGKNIYIPGKFHTVQPIALERYNFYKTNSREYTILETENFGKVVHVEVGALGVGKISNLHENYRFKKGEEKGMFEFGGSTIVLLVKKDMVYFDKDILDNSNEGIETIVKYGSRIGKRIS